MHMEDIIDRRCIKVMLDLPEDLDLSSPRMSEFTKTGGNILMEITRDNRLVFNMFDIGPTKGPNRAVLVEGRVWPLPSTYNKTIREFLIRCNNRCIRRQRIHSPLIGHSATTHLLLCQRGSE